MVNISVGSAALFGWGLVLATVVGLVVGGLWTRRRDRWFRWAVDYRGFLILAVAGSGLLLGFLGELSRFGDLSAATLPSFGSLLDRLYAAVQELLLNGSVAADSETPKWSQAARGAGLALLILLAYEAINKIFADPILTYQLRRQKGHTVVFGLGRIGFHLVQDLLTQGKQLTVVELDPANVFVPRIEETRALLVVGNATDETQLTRVNVVQAAEIFVVTGQDEINLEITTDILKLIAAESSPRRSYPKLFLNLRNLRLAEVCNRAAEKYFPDKPRTGIASRPVVRPFNSLDRSLQRLFDEDILSRRPQASDEVAHFVIVGFGEAGQEIALHLAELAHFENLKRSRMTIVYGGHERHEVEKFQRLYPQFFPTEVADPWQPRTEMDDWNYGTLLATSSSADAQRRIDMERSRGVTFVVNGGFVQMDGGVTENEFVEKIVAVCQQPGTKTMVFLCNSVDDQSCVDAVELRHELDRALKSKAAYCNEDWRVTLFPFLPQRPTLFDVYDSQYRSREDLIPWGDCRSSCNHARLTSDLWHRLAVEIHRDYARLYRQPTDRPFEQVELWERYSNAQAAKHLNAKLAVIGTHGLQVGTPDAPMAPLSPTEKDRLKKLVTIANDSGLATDSEPSLQLELIARIEHNRWMAERLLADWHFGVKNAPGLPENKRRLSLVPWESLSESERPKDFSQICRILKYCLEQVSTHSDTAGLLALGQRNAERAC